MIKPVRPIYNEDYNHFYGFLDYKGQVILDIGGDYGSTAWFFLERGAKKVISVEKNKSYVDRLVANIKDTRIVVSVHMNLDTSIKGEDLLQEYKPDIVHMDCEGCERHFLSLPSSSFRIPKIYQIELHGQELIKKFFEKFDINNYEIIHLVKWLPNVWIVVAVRVELNAI